MQRSKVHPKAGPQKKRGGPALPRANPRGRRPEKLISTTKLVYTRGKKPKLLTLTTPTFEITTRPAGGTGQRAMFTCSAVPLVPPAT